MDFDTLSRLAATSSSQKQKSFSDRYKVQRLLGRGSYGAAFLVERTSRDGTTRPYVAKECTLFNDEDGRFDNRRLESARSESKLLSRLKHPNIVRYVDVVEEPDKIWILMKYCEGGDLKSFLKKRGPKQPLPEETIVRWAWQLSSALAYLHRHRVLHRDIKPGDILLSSKTDVESVLLADFGVSKVVSCDEAMTKVGTPLYFSPEMASGSPYSSKNDVWSLGAVLLELVLLRNPFEAHSHMGIFKNISTWKEPTVSSLRLMSPPELQGQYSDALLEVLAGMLQPDPNRRVTAADVCQHPLFKGFHTTEEDQSLADTVSAVE